jgi:8-oxo-dGTP pyrophosphatase MutT (NUDIX family)
MTYEGAGLILFTPDLKVLIVQDAKTGKWGFPKGHREPQDGSDLETACRELLEETGIRPESFKLYEPSFRITRGSSSYLFRYGVVSREDGAVQNYQEIAQLAWIPFIMLISPAAEFDGNKYLRTWIEDMQKASPKKSVHLFNSVIQQQMLELIVNQQQYLPNPVSAPTSS